MFCVVTVVHIHVFCCYGGTLHVLCCYGGTCTCFVLLRWYMYMFCVVTVVHIHVLCCYGGTCTCFVLRHIYAGKNFKSTAIKTILFNI